MSTDRFEPVPRALATSLFLIAAACGDSSGNARDSGAAAPATSASTSPAAPATASAQPNAAPTANASASSPGSSLRTRSVSPFGVVLTDARGRTLYLLEEDRSGESRCLQMCAVIWPPFLGSAGSPPSAGDSLVRAALIGTRPRAGGGVQVTYNGHPLYYYLGDREAGEALGHHVEDSWGEWAAVTPAGRQVEGDRVGESGRGRRGRGRDDD